MCRRTFLYGYSEKPPYLVAFDDTLGIDTFDLTPWVPIEGEGRKNNQTRMQDKEGPRANHKSNCLRQPPPPPKNTTYKCNGN